MFVKSEKAAIRKQVTDRLMAFENRLKIYETENLYHRFLLDVLIDIINDANKASAFFPAAYSGDVTAFDKLLNNKQYEHDQFSGVLKLLQEITRQLSRRAEYEKADKTNLTEYTLGFSALYVVGFGVQSGFQFLIAHLMGRPLPITNLIMLAQVLAIILAAIVTVAACVILYYYLNESRINAHLSTMFDRTQASKIYPSMPTNSQGIKKTGDKDGAVWLSLEPVDNKDVVYLAKGNERGIYSFFHNHAPAFNALAPDFMTPSSSV